MYKLTLFIRKSFTILACFCFYFMELYKNYFLSKNVIFLYVIKIFFLMLQLKIFLEYCIVLYIFRISLCLTSPLDFHICISVPLNSMQNVVICPTFIGVLTFLTRGSFSVIALLSACFTLLFSLHWPVNKKIIQKLFEIHVLLGHFTLYKLRLCKVFVSQHL